MATPILEHKYRAILLGEPGVGKTTLALRIKHGIFVNTMTVENTREAASVVYKATANGEDIYVCICYSLTPVYTSS